MPSTPVAETGPPPYFYGVNNDQIARFASSTGASVNYLTDERSPSRAMDAQRVGTGIYYLRTDTGCNNKLVSVPETSRNGDQPETTIVPSDDGYFIEHFGATDGVTVIYEAACSPQTIPQAQLVIFGRTASPRRVAFRSAPPLIDSEIAVAVTSRGSQAFAVIRTGTQTYVARFNPATVASATPADHLCGSLPGQAQAVAVSGLGQLYVAVQAGSSIKVLTCSVSSSQEIFAAAGTASPSTLSVANDGSAILLTDTAGHVWAWTREGATRLAVYNPVPSASW